MVPASPLRSSCCPARLRGHQRRANEYNRWALVRVWCAQQSSGDGADDNAYTDDGCGVCFHDGHRKGKERRNRENTSTHRQRTPRRGETTATHGLQRTPHTDGCSAKPHSGSTLRVVTRQGSLTDTPGLWCHLPGGKVHRPCFFDSHFSKTNDAAPK